MKTARSERQSEVAWVSAGGKRQRELVEDPDTPTLNRHQGHGEHGHQHTDRHQRGTGWGSGVSVESAQEE